MTLAMGDADVKGDGVTSDPEVSETRLTSSDEYFIMACDGLWDVMSNEDAVAMIKDTVKAGDKGWDPSYARQAHTFSSGCYHSKVLSSQLKSRCVYLKQPQALSSCYPTKVVLKLSAACGGISNVCVQA